MDLSNDAIAADGQRRNDVCASVKQCCALLALAVLALCSSQSALADVSLKFGIYASEKPSLLVAQFRPLLDYLAQEMSKSLDEPVRIELNIATNYDEGIKALADGKVDFSRLGAASYFKARGLAPRIEMLALENDGGDKVFHGVIFVRADSGLEHLSDLKGKHFAFGDPHSTAGRYLSQYALSRAGVRAKDLAGYQYLGRHDRVAEAVWHGDFSAGAVKEDVFLRMQKEGRAVKALTRMRNVTGPWAARAGLPPRLVASLRAALLSVPEAVGVASIRKNGFLAASAEDLDLIRQAIDANNQFFE